LKEEENDKEGRNKNLSRQCGIRGEIERKRGLGGNKQRIKRTKREKKGRMEKMELRYKKE
jgi:hypothetical protein